MPILEEIVKQIKEARCPEDIFGDVTTDMSSIEIDDVITKTYHMFSLLVHPDTNSRPDAGDVFNILTTWKDAALDKNAHGIYGNRIVLSLSHNGITYHLKTLECDDGISTWWSGETQDAKRCICRISSTEVDNMWLLREYDNLQKMPDPSEALKTARIQIMNSFKVPGDEPLRVNTFTHDGVAMPLQRAMTHFPTGMLPVHVAWIINRVLGMLIEPHAAGVIHGAILPPSVWINFPEHSGFLGNWSASIKEGRTPAVYFSDYKEFYPEEYFMNTPLNRNCDVYMTGMLAIHLLGGNLKDRTFPSNVPPEMMVVIKAATLGPAHRFPDVNEFYFKWKEALKKIYGKRTFVKFEFPPLTTT